MRVETDHNGHNEAGLESPGSSVTRVWVQAGVPAGLLLATGVFELCSMLPEAAFLRWGWRVPFLMGIVLLGVGLFIRLRLLESPLFKNVVETGRSVRLPALEAIRRYPRNVLLATGARFAENGCFYIFTVFVLTYATTQLNLAKTTILNAVLLASTVHFFVIPAFGILSDRIGRRPVYLGGAIALALLAFPFFALVDTGATAMICLALVLGLVAHAAMYGPQAAFFSELFGTEVRYSGASIGYQLSSCLSGGLAPLIATTLLSMSGGRPWPIAIYLIALAAITIVSVWLAEEPHRVELSRPLGERAD